MACIAVLLLSDNQMKKYFIFAMALALSACATKKQDMYQWGGYDGLLYEAYKDPNKVEEFRIKLENQIAASESAKQKVAPGLYAEVGTIYLQSGAKESAVKYYKLERDTWPESKALMTSMIENIERRPTKEEIKK